jgi:hypothetical protein
MITTTDLPVTAVDSAMTAIDLTMQNNNLEHCNNNYGNWETLHDQCWRYVSMPVKFHRYSRSGNKQILPL